MPADYEKHPSYGMITVTRSQSNGMYLFGSDARHHHTVHVEISRGSVKHDLAREWYSQEERLVEFHMSEAQWARFVSSFGDGTGTPITLRRTEGSPLLPSCPPVKPLVEPFEADVSERIDRINEHAESALGRISSMLGGNKPATKADLREIKEHLEHLQRDLNQNLNFVEKSFKEKLSRHVDDAMINLDAQMTHALKVRGLEGLRRELAELPDQHAPLIPEKTEPHI